MRRALVALGAVGAIVVTVVWWFLFISPRNTAIDDANRQLEAAEDEQRRLEAQVSELESIKDSEVSYIFAVGEMETSIPVNPDLDTFIEDLTFLAERSGVDLLTLTSAAPSPSPLTPGLFEVALGANVNGEYFEVLGFLFGLEEMERLVRVDSVTLSPLGAEDAEAAGDGEPTNGEPTNGEPTNGEPTNGETTGGETTSGDAVDAGEESATPRPSANELSVNLTAMIFTRSEVLVAGGGTGTDISDIDTGADTGGTTGEESP